MSTKLGIVAGAGDLPGRLIAACHEARREVFVIAFEGIADAAPIDAVAHEWVRLGAVGRTLSLLHEAGVEEVVLAGPVGRLVPLRSLRPDARGLTLLKDLGKGAFGDARLLSRIVRAFEEDGFRVLGVEEILTDLLAPRGPVGALEPDADALADIATAVEVARVLGALDVGQAVVTQQGIVLGVEAAEGTDALLERCAALRREGPGGVLVKLRKPGQERRADLPAIGPRTIEGARAAGLRGIAVEAAGALIIDRSAVAQAADAAGIFVIGMALDDA